MANISISILDSSLEHFLDDSGLDDPQGAHRQSSNEFVKWVRQIQMCSFHRNTASRYAFSGPPERSEWVN